MRHFARSSLHPCSLLPPSKSFNVNRENLYLFLTNHEALADYLNSRRSNMRRKNKRLRCLAWLGIQSLPRDRIVWESKMVCWDGKRKRCANVCIDFHYHPLRSIFSLFHPITSTQSKMTSCLLSPLTFFNILIQWNDSCRSRVSLPAQSS